MKTQTLNTFKILILSLVLAGGLQIAAAAWTSAPANPPSNNVDAPINVGVSQAKKGSLTIQGLDSSTNAALAYGFRVLNGNVGIGLSDPQHKLDVWGGSIRAGGGLIIEVRTTNPNSPETGRMWLIQ